MRRAERTANPAESTDPAGFLFPLEGRPGRRAIGSILRRDIMATNTGAANGNPATKPTAITLPGGMVLGARERLVQSASFRFSPAHFFLSSRHVLTSERLAGDRPNALFGLLTMGSETFSYSLLNMASAGTGLSIQVLPLLIGLIMLAVAAGDIAAYWPGLLVGGFFCLAACQAILRVVNTDGGAAEVKLSIFDRGKARALANRINAAIAAG
jgi:hypothetical protein